MSLLTRDIPPRAAAAVVALALVASVVAGREKPTQEVIGEVSRPSPERSARVEGEAELNLDKLRRALPRPGADDPFAPRSFAPPPPKMAMAAPAKPTAPPLPFAYLGKVIDGGKTSVFVGRGSENYSLEPGQTIGGAYRVEKITDTDVTFTYLPMKTRQTLHIPSGE
jgi:hypothetical protein